MNNLYILLLDLQPLKGSILCLEDTQQYLDFFFDKKLIFYQHIHHYTNKAFFMIKSMKMLGNSSKGLSLIYKQLLYRMYVLLIMLYGFWLWYFKGASLYQSLKNLKKIQRRATLQITEAFCISLTWRIETIASLVPIHFHFNKIIEQHL